MPDENNQNPNSLDSTFQVPPEQPAGQTPPNSAAYLSPKPPQKSKKILIISIAAVVVVLAASAVAYLLLRDKSSEPDDKTKAATTLTALGDVLESSLGAPTNEVSALTYQADDSTRVVDKLDGNVWVGVDKDSNVLSLNSQRDTATENESDFNNLTKQLKSEGFEKISATSDYSKTKTVTAYYSSDNFACTLLNMPEEKSYLLQIDCADRSDFNNNTQAIKPFADVYLSSKESTTKDLLLNSPDIQDSATKDYKTAKLNITELNNYEKRSAGLFYQTPDKKWNFFTASSDPDKIKCSSYDSDDLKNAFAGFTCWDDSSDSSSFVQKTNPTFEIVPGSQG